MINIATRRHMAVAAAIGSALALSACGGGGDDDIDGIGGGSSGSVALATKADVLRELGTVSSVASFFTDTLESVTTVGVAAKQASFGRGTRQTGDAFLKAVENCPDGGTSDSSSGNKTYNFDFFDRSATVAFDRFIDSSCRDVEPFQGGTTTYTYDGVDETGDTLQGTTPMLGYRLAGSGNRPVTFTQRDQYTSNNTFFEYTSAYLGEMQMSETSSQEQYASALVFAYRENDNGTRYNVDATIGFDGQPFRVTINTVTGALLLNGLVRYSTSECRGGEVSIATPSALTEAAAGFVNGGAVRIGSGSATVTVTFNGDGSATYQGSTAGTLTRAEVEAALDQGDC